MGVELGGVGRPPTSRGLLRRAEAKEGARGAVVETAATLGGEGAGVSGGTKLTAVAPGTSVGGEKGEGGGDAPPD